MTIKSQGGIFGRNPTFNDVEVDGTLTVGGNPVPDASTILVDGDIGSTVQGYDADTAKLDAVQTWTATQNFATTTATATGYGTTDPSSPVDIFTATAGNANYEAIEMTNYDYGVGETGQSISIISKVRNDGGGLSPTAALYFVKESDYSSAANRDGALAIYTNRSNSFVEAARFTSEGNLKFSTSGSGIDFSATAGTGTSELFDDYEEGVFNVAFVTTSGSITISSTADTMSYTKIGNIVHIQGYLASSAVSSPSGDLKITGLPFTSANGIAELGDYAVGTVWLTGTSADIDGGVIAYIPAGSTDLFFRVNAVSGANNTVASSVDSGTEFMIGLTYTAA